ncbi:hypothetical protein RF11_10188 [Thelohanellus kitauei]|uniref:Sortilin C-terminal domain-containing protein n=1 Tax=Thelohanellus kitauei TaxID=669202 RepID=A0A0C2N7R7_THEKT|nr:hypothetical protein RF11_10188 [Thelohanellus kitauei]
MKIGILRVEKVNEIFIKIINLHNTGMRVDFTDPEKFNEYFYLHGYHYILAVDSDFSLCLCTLNIYDELIPLVCNLAPYDRYYDKCAFVIHPYLFGVIYANLKINGMTRTYVSFDNGKNFNPMKLDRTRSKCHEQNCWIELDLKCSTDLTQNNFPERWIVKFQGTYHRKGTISRHSFISFDGGRIWKMLDLRIEKVIFQNGGWLLVAIEKWANMIWYSYDEARTWYKETIWDAPFIDIIQGAYIKHDIIAVINYNKLSKSRRCREDDFENWYVPRLHGNCYQGEEVFYLKKKPSAMCVDNRTEILSTIKPCPCSIEDFPWYPNFIIKFFQSNFNKHSDPLLLKYEQISTRNTPLIRELDMSMEMRPFNKIPQFLLLY